MANKCLRCKQTVYATERFPGIDTYFHKNCFKCSNEKCGTLLTLRTYQSFGDKIFCKQHAPGARATLVTKNVAQKANFGGETKATPSAKTDAAPKTPTKEEPRSASSTPTQEQRPRSSSSVKTDDVSVSDTDMKAIIERGANCKRCGIQVVGIATVAAGNVYHEACFACIKCSKPILPGHSFTCEGADGDPTCADCVPSVKCNACNKQITSEYLITGYGGSLHSQCHVCCVCKAPFGTEEYIVTDGKAYCKKDNPVPALADCAGCGKPVDDGVEALDKMWHTQCFVCSACKKEVADSFVEKDGALYCEEDYRSRFCVKCDTCADFVLTGEYLTVKGKNYHPQCIKCTSCKQPFKGGDQLFLRGEEPFCKEHS